MADVSVITYQMAIAGELRRAFRLYSNWREIRVVDQCGPRSELLIISEMQDNIAFSRAPDQRGSRRFIC
jgi:hypothetical protein